MELLRADCVEGILGINERRGRLPSVQSSSRDAQTGIANISRHVIASPAISLDRYSRRVHRLEANNPTLNNGGRFQTAAGIFVSSDNVLRNVQEQLEPHRIAVHPARRGYPYNRHGHRKSNSISQNMPHILNHRQDILWIQVLSPLDLARI
ncbi:hypothetical protein M422DRAFT_259569 [Sphaerobolus stellatus SS14]|uniref:Uncharacterized protein n=1 Tax=Sphaerobolus stellatus (strain SS14) TaxID=990650 RepID=A0A0C9U4T8_SPHS4|nr:hypothetical protein M422DRAFT_259569 [Sphaerobolus stellatus SS14]